MMDPTKRARGERVNTSKLRAEQVLAISGDRRPQRAVAKDFKVCKSSIGYIRNKRHWKHLNVPADAAAIAHENRSEARSGEKNPAAKLSRRKVAAIRKTKGTLVAIGAKYGVSRSLIGAIRRGEIWL